MKHQCANIIMLDYTKVIREVETWAREVGKMQKEHLGKDMAVDTKSSKVDLVTDLDRWSEAYLMQAIHERYPGHAILSEEYGKHDVASDYLWIIDPLDGTTNYAQGLHIFAVSIALQYQSKTMLGVIYGSVLDQMFGAVRGLGAHLNGKSLRVSDKTNLRECVLATGFPYDRAENPDNNVNYFSRITPQVRGIRRMGSAAYDLANVSAGLLDGYWELNLSPWDVAAGILILEEAGGKVVYLPEKRGISLVAGNEDICQKILDEIRAVDSIGAWLEY
ncbi:inositol-1-monophosphatase [hydrocarbon metagenome]|uniref:inositol-phosphate phosphatase n=1 Tax=hydrocarbon metagenome TaxID=938273 RepID=A0A0W8E834_9ZZZZ